MDERKLIKLDPKTNSVSAFELLGFVRKHLVGQEEAVNLILDLYEKTISPLSDVGKPALYSLFLGPSGVGKTTLAKMIARFLLSTYDSRMEIDLDERVITRVDCGSYGEYDISRLIGSSAGYIGYDDIPALDQRYIDEPAFKILKKMALDYKFGNRAQQLANQINLLNNGLTGMIEANKRRDYFRMIDQAVQEFIDFLRKEKGIRIWSVVVLDEFEKGHQKLHDVFLPVFAEGNAVLANNRITSFRDTILIMTSNAGSEAIKKASQGVGQVGFSKSDISISVKDIAMTEMKKIFRTEFLSRLGKKTVVFHHLDRTDIENIIELQIKTIQEKLANKFPIVIEVDQTLKDYIVDETMKSPEYGVRLLEDHVEENIIITLAKMINAGTVMKCDTVVIRMSEDRQDIEFYRLEKPYEDIESEITKEDDTEEIILEPESTGFENFIAGLLNENNEE